ncbi:uncharacterized protein STEHIDRAFT_146537, partial [Stereum hirsutum FP-91666 SS1]|uniref:uncharacterized protein n=1 Tax=Stereum hirsutum (strain FP-91666) TaxID=721885 RepID=UPI000440CB12
MSFLARSPVLRQSAAALRAPSQVRNMSSDYHHLPFKYESKPGTAFKVIGVFALGFFTPFMAAVYQLKKASAA